MSLFMFDTTGSNFNANGNMNMKIRTAGKSVLKKVKYLTFYIFVS